MTQNRNCFFYFKLTSNVLIQIKRKKNIILSILDYFLYSIISFWVLIKNNHLDHEARSFVSLQNSFLNDAEIF